MNNKKSMPDVLLLTKQDTDHLSTQEAIDGAIQYIKYDLLEELLATIGCIVQMMRGMQNDPLIPDRAKEAMKHKIEELESIVSNHTQ